MDNNNGDLNVAEQFFKQLINEGAKISCDETNESYTESDNRIPMYYDEKTFKRGQKFFHHYVFGMFLGKLLGLVSILSVPSILNVLKFTNQSSEPLTAYKRYLSTLMHMNVWYNKDFKPGSDTWRSIQEVRAKHNFASKRCIGKGFERITQLDMALTQFGFMGFALTCPQEIGIHHANDDDLRCFVHVWRVVGHLMGIEDRFNICRDSLEETRTICKLLSENIFKPQINKQEKDFIEMSNAMINGMWCMHPLLQENSHMLYLIKLLNKNSENQEIIDKKYETFTTYEKFLYWLIGSTIYFYQYFLLRVYHNTVMNISFWLMDHFPFLAFYKFGKENSYVTILNTNAQRN